MPRELSPDEIKDVLERGAFQELLGTVEGLELECKSAPYQLDTDRQKLELSKDISGLANANGGWLLIGIRTRRDPIHYGDILCGVGEFPQEAINPQDYHDIVNSWIFPPVRGLSLRWYPSIDDTGRGIVGVEVPEQSSSDKPFLIGKSLIGEDADICSGLLVGIFERMHATTQPKSVQEIQALMRDGARFNSITGYLESYRELLSSYHEEVTRRREEPEAVPGLGALELVLARLDGALEVAGLLHRPMYSLTMVPLTEVLIPSLFESRDTPVVQLLWQPPEIRRNGFDLNTLEFPRIVGNQLRRAAMPGGRKILELWRDGSLIFAATGDGDFLCWGRRAQQDNLLVINQIVLVESTYLFMKLLEGILESMEPSPNEIELGLHIRMDDQDSHYLLHPGPLSRWQFTTDAKQAPESEGLVSIRVEIEGFNPGITAYRLLCEVYAWFELEYENIPYVEGEDNHRSISEELIRSASP